MVNASSNPLSTDWRISTVSLPAEAIVMLTPFNSTNQEYEMS
jgi:hypothetical protein